jgi:hypothetical protein
VEKSTNGRLSTLAAALRKIAAPREGSFISNQSPIVRVQQYRCHSARSLCRVSQRET